MHEDGGAVNEEDENRNQNLEEEGEFEDALPEGAVNDDNNNNNEAAQNAGAVVANNANNDDANWNPIEWDRAAEGFEGTHTCIFGDVSCNNFQSK